MRVHRYAQLHTATFAGKTICVESPNGRFPGAALLTGRKLKSVTAHGKHLAYDFGRDRKLHIHLGRFGDFTEGKMPFPEVKGVLRMRLVHHNRLAGATRRHRRFRLFRCAVASGGRPSGRRPARAPR